MKIKQSKIMTPVVSIVRWTGRNYPETLVRIRYLVRFHRFLNLKNPKNLNEKILYLSLKTDTTLWSTLSDKNAVRKYIKDVGLEEILIPQYAYYENADQIDPDLLPEQFVIKTTHGSGDVLIVKDKNKLNVNEVKTYFSEMLKHRYGEFEGGIHYMRIKPALTVEALITNDEWSSKYSTSLIDYKFWCFNGEPRYCWVCCNRDKNGTDVVLYDIDWNPHFEWSRFNDHYRKGVAFEKPKNYERMLEICRILSKPFPCVSVDLYDINGKIYFGELTFTRLGGMIDFFTDEWLMKAGAEINLPQ